MNERSSNSMLSFVADTLCCELKEKFIFAMPRVVPDQRATFESDELFRKLSRECEVRYTGFRDRPLDERQLRFQAECREGHADVAFVCTGTTLQLNFSANSWSEQAEDRVLTREYVDFDSEPGRVHLKSQFILNGVCVLWRGYIDLIRLDGMGCLEFDRERAEVEASLLREQVEQDRRNVHQFEDRRRQQQQQLDQERHERHERQASSEAESRSGRRKNRCRRDLNLPLFISSHTNIFSHSHRAGFGIGHIENNSNSCYPSNINLNNNNSNTTSIINSINSIRSHIINNAHLHAHYHPHFQHQQQQQQQQHQHHHHRRRQVCDCCLPLSLPATPSTNTTKSRHTKGGTNCSPERVPQDLSSPHKSASQSRQDKPNDQDSWKHRHKTEEPVEEEIEIDVVELEADPESDIDIEGEDEGDGQTRILAGDTEMKTTETEVPVTPQEGVTLIVPQKTTGAGKVGSRRPVGEIKTLDSKPSFTGKPESTKETSSGRKGAGMGNLLTDIAMEGVENPDPVGRREGAIPTDSSSAEHAGPMEMRSEASRSGNMAPREADNQATARDKRRKSDTIWSPWK